MKAVIGVGAPSYTSGVHMWNGTAAILKPKPTSTRTSATMTGSVCCAATNFDSPAETPAKVVWPVKPNSKLKPYNMIVEVNAPNKKYFIPASVEGRVSRMKPASMYKQI